MTEHLDIPREARVVLDAIETCPADLTGGEEQSVQATGLKIPEAWLVGGLVREALIKAHRGSQNSTPPTSTTPLSPCTKNTFPTRNTKETAASTDIDITTNLLPGTVSALFRNLGYPVIETGLKHGTVTVLIGTTPVEITTFRQDGEYADSRHPTQVRFINDITEDLSRRDFTINAIAYNPVRGLRDPFSGTDDLKAHLLRAVGDPKARFQEDALRILRALRFAAQKGFTIESRTRSALFACAPLLNHIAAERIRDELNKLLCASAAVDVLHEYADIIALAIPEIRPCIGFEQNSRYHCYDVWEHILHAISTAPQDSTIRWALLFHDIGKPACATIDENGEGHFYGHARESAAIAHNVMRRLKFPRKELEEIELLVERHDSPIEPQKAAVKRAMGKCKSDPALFEKLLEVKRCDSLAHAPHYQERAQIVDDVRRVYEEIMQENEAFSLKSLAITGSDIIALGIAPGPAIGQYLHEALNAVIEGQQENEQDALIGFVKGQITLEGVAGEAKKHD